MALLIATPKPKSLLADIKQAIDDGHVDTWEYDSEGDFTHTPEQWRGAAWMHPTVGQGFLFFGLIGLKDVVMTTEIYAIYHGRFAEMLLAHFDHRFSSIEVTALGKEPPDRFKAAQR